MTSSSAGSTEPPILGRALIFAHFQTNLVRGIVAAVVCAAVFAILGLVHKFKWRPPKIEAKDDPIPMKTQENPAFEKSE